MYSKKNPIHINPKNKGLFTSKANSAGMSVGEFAQKTLLSGSKATTKTKREAQFAVNARKFNHKKK